MTRKDLEWFVIIGNTLAIIAALITHSLLVYLQIAGVPNGCFLDLLFCEWNDKRKKNLNYQEKPKNDSKM